jgi:hypothetical protein
MTQHETSPTPRQYAEQVLAQAELVLSAAVGIAFPETPDLDPVQAFPKPTEVRAESPGIPELTEDRQARLMDKASLFGYGRAEDVTLSEQGLFGATVNYEGGQPHKMYAEALMVVNDRQANPKAHILSASPYRELKSESEIASAKRLFGRAGRTEYDVGFDVARALPGFIEYPEPIVLNASYDVNNDFAVSDEPTGQFQTIGEIDGAPFILMEISRRVLENGKYDNQPRTDDVIAIVDAVSRAQGDEDSPIVNVTSGTYVPSRALGVAIASLSANRLVGIAAYGNDRLNKIKGTNARAPVDQLPAELHVVATRSVKLRQVLNK